MSHPIINREDYMEDARGRLVPRDMVKEIDKTRDILVRDLVKKALGVQEAIIKFKNEAMSEIRAFVDLSAMEWDVKLGGKNWILQPFNLYPQIAHDKSEQRTSPV